jgi:hypothetical protein
MLIHSLLRFLPIYCSHFCWRLLIPTLTSVIPSSLIFSSLLPFSNLYPPKALYYCTDISYSQLLFYAFITFTIRHSISSDRSQQLHFCRLHSSHFFLPLTPDTRIHKYVGTSMLVTVVMLYIRKGCFWHFRKNVSLICSQNCWYLLVLIY